MKQISIHHIILLGILYLAFDSFFPFKKEGFSQKEVEQSIKLHDLAQENNLLKKQNNQYEVKIIQFRDEKSKIDSITNGYNEPQIDSFYTNYFKR